MSDKVYKDDVGTLIQIDCGSDISSATVTQVKVRLPDNTTTTWAASLNGEQVLEYNLVASDTATAGFLTGNVYIVTPEGIWHGETFEIRIYEPYT